MLQKNSTSKVADNNSFNGRIHLKTSSETLFHVYITASPRVHLEIDTSDEVKKVSNSWRPSLIGPQTTIRKHSSPEPPNWVVHVKRVHTDRIDDAVKALRMMQLKHWIMGFLLTNLSVIEEGVNCQQFGYFSITVEMRKKEEKQTTFHNAQT